MLHWFSKRINELHKAKRDERGFTLIELLVVVIIIGILAAIAIPVFLGQRERAQDTAAISSARNAATTMQTLATDCQGLYKKGPACTAAISGADLVAAESSLGTPAAPSAPTVAVALDFKSYTVKYTSASGKVATYDSTTSKTTIA